LESGRLKQEEIHMHKHSLKDFAGHGRVADATAFAGANASGLERRRNVVAMYPRDRRNKARPLAQGPGHDKAAPREDRRRRVGSVGALYAHAMAIEREAVVRYREFAAHMAERGNDTVAELFRHLAQFGTEHAYHLAKKTAGMALPNLAAGEYSWLDQDAPVPEAHAFVLRMLTPRLALEIALRAEQRAKAFFDTVIDEASDAGIRETALGMAREEEAQITWVNEALARVPKPYQATEEQPGDPTIPQQL
jgi:rubrerythrin